MTPHTFMRGAVLALFALTLAACATPAQDAGSRSPSASPSPTCAVAEQPGVEPPPGCVVYDAEKNMALNEGYRERADQPEAGRAAGEALIGPATASLEALRTSGATITEEAVRSALVEAGVDGDSIQTDGVEGSFAFGAAVAGGGCIHGGITPEGVSVEIGGFIADGGCLAMVGH